MSQHAFELFIVQEIKNALRHRNRGMLRIAPGGKSIRRVGWNHIKLWHRNANFLGKPLDYLISSRQLFACYWPGAISGKSNFVRKEISDKVGPGGNYQRQ